MNCFFIVVVGLVCPRDPRGYVVGGFLSPGRFSHGKLVMVEGPDNERLKNPYEQKIHGIVYPAFDRVTMDMSWSQA